MTNNTGRRSQDMIIAPYKKFRGWTLTTFYIDLLNRVSKKMEAESIISHNNVVIIHNSY